MTKKEFARKLAENIRQNPSADNITKNANLLLALPSRRDVDDVLQFLDDELGSFGAVLEQFDNGKVLTVMQMFHSIIDKAQRREKS
ncbi:MAG: hypothetical protein IJR85_07010 [Synergistaceae bacterium]|nr:hypothetical protein [Synergistaceae bacterium]